jgi:hypothetical protein
MIVDPTSKGTTLVPSGKGRTPQEDTRMTLKTFVAAMILSVSPLAAFAQCSGQMDQQAMSCAEGTQYDVETGTCVPIATT